MPFYSNGTYYNWTTLLPNMTNSTNPIGTLATAPAKALPWFWPIIPFLLYIYLLSLFGDSPSNGKFIGITALVLVISVFLAASGYTSSAALNIVLFLLAWVSAWIFKI